MHQPSPSLLGYIRATVCTVVAVAIIPLVFVGLGYESMHSPDWDPNGDSGAVQGFVFISLACALAVFFACTAFPLAAARLKKQGRFVKSEFLKLLRIWLAIVSALLGLSLGAMGSLIMFIPISLLCYCIVSLLALPFAHLWYKLANDA